MPAVGLCVTAEDAAAPASGEAAEGVVEEGAAKEDGGEEGPHQLPFNGAIFLLLCTTVTAPCTLGFSHAHLDLA